MNAGPVCSLTLLVTVSVFKCLFFESNYSVDGLLVNRINKFLVRLIDSAVRALSKDAFDFEVG